MRDNFDLLLEVENDEEDGLRGFVMYANGVGYPVGLAFFNAHLDLFVACDLVDRDLTTGWNTVRFATKEPLTDKTIGDIAAQIIESGAAVRVGCIFDGHVHRPSQAA